jgi:hypothetical protein
MDLTLPVTIDFRHARGTIAYVAVDNVFVFVTESRRTIAYRYKN